MFAICWTAEQRNSSPIPAQLALYFAKDIGARIGLRDERAHVLWNLVRIDMARGEYDRDVVRGRAASNVESVELSRHANVSEDKIDMHIFSEHPQGIVGICGFDDAISSIPERVAYIEPDECFIFHHEDRLAGGVIHVASIRCDLSD